MVSKNYRLKLCAKFVWVRLATLSGAAARPRLKAWPCSPAPPAGRRIFGGGFAPLGASLRRVAGVSRLYWCNSPRLVVWSRLEVVWRPTCRPPRRRTLTTRGCGRAVLRLGGSDVWPRVSLARSPLRCEREPAIACANQLFRTSTLYSVSGRGCPRSHQRVNVRMRRPRLVLAG